MADNNSNTISIHLPIEDIRAVYFIGAGGTGGYIIRDVIRLLAQESMFEGEIVICDPDIVEMKNINRQNFTYEDIGQNKARVLANRYGALYNVTINCFEEFIDSENLYNIIKIKHIERKNTSGPSKIIIIDSVDTKKARLSIYQAIKNLNRWHIETHWISAGNEKRDGQVIYSYHCSDINTATIVDMFGHEFTKKALQAEQYELDRISCAQNNIEDPQSIAANLSSAHNAILMFYNLLYDNITYNYVDFNIYNSSKANYVKVSAFRKDLTLEDLVKNTLKENTESLENAFLKSA